MTCLPASVLTLLLNYLLSSEGVLLPPLNLSVVLLDFHTSVHWLPGPGNPIGTRYSVEFTEIKHFSKPVWNGPANCTNITSTQCYLELDQLFTDYIVRVMAEWKEERSNWTLLKHTFQLYKNTQLSPPNMKIFPYRHSVQINLSHLVQLVRDVSLRFSVDLFRLTSDHRVQHIGKSISTGSLNFLHLPAGYNYCINASAFYTQMTEHKNLNATKCILLHDESHRGVPHISGVVVGVGVLLLLIITTGIVLSTKSCFMRKIGNSYIPKALRIIVGTDAVLTLKPEVLHAPPISITNTDFTAEAAHEEVDENPQQGYFERERFPIAIRRGSEDEPEDANFPGKVDAEDEMLPRKLDFYSSAVNMEETEDHLIVEEGPTSVFLMQWSPTFSSLSRTSFDKADIKISHQDLDDEENSKTERQLLSYSPSCSLETSELSEEEMDSAYSDHFLGSSYEPRPDPCLM
ncbi:cytokine receptor family member B12 isoform X2 [Colossoma macropomum]|uniref:cytokine receptor family member B12 isoform X2 n=1 Tax=Colossoma macropomum TaxID=42526 RepID=UPI00186531ED|nr:cytokine receptor family member B12 isoform X2 [Colossoma macropomum]